MPYEATVPRVLRNPDVETVHGVMSQLLCPFDLKVRARPGCDASFRHDALGHLGITTSGYGAAVEVAVEPRESFYVLQMPIAGDYEARGLGPTLRLPRGTPHVVHPLAPLRMRWNAGSRLVIVRLERAALEDCARVLWDAEPRTPLIFSEVVPLGSEAGASISRCLEFLRVESAQSRSLLRSGHGARQAEQMLMALLLGTLDRRPPVHERGVRPYFVKRAEEFIEANLDADIGLVDVVACAGVSVRTLTRGFQRRHRVPPMAWLKERRLARVRAELLAATPSTTTVTEVAVRWGFGHLGRFAAAYRSRFGERPSDTLRGSQRLD